MRWKAQREPEANYTSSESAGFICRNRRYYLFESSAGRWEDGRFEICATSAMRPVRRRLRRASIQTCASSTSACPAAESPRPGRSRAACRARHRHGHGVGGRGDVVRSARARGGRLPPEGHEPRAPSACARRCARAAASRFRARSCHASSRSFATRTAPPRSCSRTGSQPLTSREWQVLDLLRMRLSTAEMARRLFISQTTVRSHVAALLRKLDVPDREAAVR